MRVNYFNDYIVFSKDNKNKKDPSINFNLDDYYIYKASASQKEITPEEFLLFKYSKYILFKKEIYNKTDIDTWLNFIIINKIKIIYITNPLPSIELTKKIEIL